MRNIGDNKRPVCAYVFACFFVILFGFLTIYFLIKLPETIDQYVTKEALLKYGDEVIADFDNVHKNGQKNNWSYIAVYSYVDNDGNKYLMPINLGQGTNLESLEDSKIKILIDGEGHCIEASTTTSEILMDMLLYLLVGLVFICLWIPFIILLIKELSYFIKKRKSEKTNS